MLKKKRSATRRKPSAQIRQRADDVRARLTAAMPTPICELDHQDAWQLLVATILSAQSTDRNVNKVTPVLFARYPTPADLAASSVEDVERVIKSTGFFRQKTKSLRGAAAIVTERFGGEVPRTIEQMMELPGVARKTANVVLGTAYRIPSGMTIDTHAGRVSRRLRLTKHDDPVKVEQDLCAVFPQDTWIDMGHRFVLHGRYVCLARKPRCEVCPLNEVCPSAEASPEKSWEERAENERAYVTARGELEAARMAPALGTSAETGL